MLLRALTPTNTSCRAAASGGGRGIVACWGSPVVSCIHHFGRWARLFKTGFGVRSCRERVQNQASLSKQHRLVPPSPLSRVPHLENSTRCHAPFLSQLQCTPFAAKQDRKLQQQFVGAPNLLVVSPTSPVPRLPALTLVISHSRNSSGTMMNSTAWRPRPGLCMISPAPS